MLLFLEQYLLILALVTYDRVQEILSNDVLATAKETMRIAAEEEKKIGISNGNYDGKWC